MESLFESIKKKSSITELMTARLQITYFEIVNLRCSESDIIPASA